MTFWRSAGLNYIQYSSIAARVVRNALKADVKGDVAKRSLSPIKFTAWKDGKPVKQAVE